MSTDERISSAVERSSQSRHCGVPQGSVLGTRFDAQKQQKLNVINYKHEYMR